MDPEQIAAAMGHLSTRSQQKYKRKSRAKGGREPEKIDPPFSHAIASTPIKIVADPNIQLKAFKESLNADGSGSIGAGGVDLASMARAAAMRKAMQPAPR